MSAGDVLLFHRPTTWENFKRDKFGTVMTTLIHLTTRSKWNHAALDIGDGMMVEATSKGVAVNLIRSSDEIQRVPLSAYEWDGRCAPGQCLVTYVGDDLEQVLAWSTGRVGWRYGTLNAFWCGLRHVIPGVAHVKHGRTIYLLRARRRGAGPSGARL